MSAPAAARKAAPLGVRLVAGTAAALALGFGALYGSQVGVVASLEREREDLETKVFVAQGKARRADSDAAETEALIGALRQQAALDAGAVDELGQQLEAARQQVQQLEAQQQQRRESAARAAAEAESAAGKLEQLRADAARFRSEAAEADRLKADAAARVAEARAALGNPLRHPALEQWRSSGGGGGGGAGKK